MKAIEIWAQKVIDIFSPIAEKVNLTWYPLQSGYVVRPDVLFIGLNPGKNYYYNNGQQKNPEWEFVDGRMTKERLLKGNPSYDLNSKKWRFVSGLKRISVFGEIISKDKYIYMNFFYFNTDNFHNVLKRPDLKEVVGISRDLTLEFIEITKPKIIVTLGIAGGIYMFNLTNKDVILNEGNRRYILKTDHKGIPVYAIPHPSRSGLIPNRKVGEMNAIFTDIKSGLHV